MEENKKTRKGKEKKSGLKHWDITRKRRRKDTSGGRVIHYKIDKREKRRRSKGGGQTAESQLLVYYRPEGAIIGLKKEKTRIEERTRARGKE